MWKDIAANYYRAYSGRRIREAWKNYAGALICMIYPVAVMLFQMKAGEETAFLIVYLPMLYILISVGMHPVRLCKMLYLCPMDADRRRQYIRRSYRFSVAVRMSAALIGTGCLVLLYDCGMIIVMEILLNDLALSVLLPSGMKSGEGGAVIHKTDVCMICMIVVSMLSNFVLALAVADREGGRIVNGIMLAGIALIVFIQIPFWNVYRKYVRSELERAVYYEEIAGCRHGR